MKVTIRLTHVAIGVPGDPCRCALALAIREQFPLCKVSVGIETVRINGLVARQWVKNFDEGKPVQPIEFDL